MFKETMHASCIMFKDNLGFDTISPKVRKILENQENSFLDFLKL